MTEKRHFRSSPRPQISCKVTLHRAKRSTDKPIVTYTRDIGTGGLFAETDQSFEMDDQVNVVLSTPSTWEPLVLGAKVCRCQASSEGETGGVGLRFVDMTDVQAIALADFIATLDYDG
ncbi:MAG: PilZ domain-containing protein [Deltaproteobacteria bacterium]|nr:PilZ domain-containing protein [Deltaproteobacteria bacterium]